VVFTGKTRPGWTAIVAGDYGYARMLSEQGAVESQGIWGATHKASFESNLGLADLFEGHHSEARQHLTRALALSRSVGFWDLAQEALAGLSALTAIEGRAEQAATLAAAAHTVCDKPLSVTSAEVFARLNDLSNGLINAAAHQPALSPQQLDLILRDASHDHAIDVPAAVPGLP
jgi:hypothetical protein